jgi:hypothetical protein
MFALMLRTQLPAQDVNAALRVPKPMKLYSANSGANIHSTPAPTEMRFAPAGKLLLA